MSDKRIFVAHTPTSGRFGGIDRSSKNLTPWQSLNSESIVRFIESYSNQIERDTEAPDITLVSSEEFQRKTVRKQR